MKYTTLHSHACKQVLASGRTCREDGVVVHWSRSVLRHNRYGVAAKTSTGGAVIRNRIRRWARQLLRSWDCALSQGFDMVIIARGREAAESFTQFEQNLAVALAKAGLSERDLCGASVLPSRAGRG